VERKLIRKRKWGRRWKLRKMDFLKKMQRKILQGGYHICSDTMLWNMASMEEMREKLQILCIDQTKILQYEKSWIQMTIAKRIYMLTN
jgi:hypothetical protein